MVAEAIGALIVLLIGNNAQSAKDTEKEKNKISVEFKKTS